MVRLGDSYGHVRRETFTIIESDFYFFYQILQIILGKTYIELDYFMISHNNVMQNKHVGIMIKKVNVNHLYFDCICKA